jgi:uncharacterized FlaG/YvyC family protein
MDVPGAVTTAPTQPQPPASTPAPAPAPAPAPVAAVSTDASSKPATPSQPNGATLSPVVAKLFNTAEQNVTVSFQTEGHTVVTVFTDKSTGKEIIQFPSQELIAFGQLLDKDAGKVLDKSV